MNCSFKAEKQATQTGYIWDNTAILTALLTRQNYTPDRTTHRAAVSVHAPGEECVSKHCHNSSTHLSAAGILMYAYCRPCFFPPPQLRSAEEAGQKKRWADAADSAEVERLQQMEKDRKEQEMLIKGYQQVCLP